MSARPYFYDPDIEKRLAEEMNSGDGNEHKDDVEAARVATPSGDTFSWKLRCVTPSGVTCVRDTASERERAHYRAQWEEAQPGRRLLSTASRNCFLGVSCSPGNETNGENGDGDELRLSSIRPLHRLILLSYP